MERRRFTREFKLEAVRLIRDRGVSYAQASQDLKVHPTQLRNWVKAFADDPQHAFPGQGQMKPEQLEIARLKRGRETYDWIPDDRNGRLRSGSRCALAPGGAIDKGGSEVCSRSEAHRRCCRRWQFGYRAKWGV